MSARMNIPHERVIGLRANHRTMCRFASSDSLVMQTVMRQIMAVAESVLYGPSEGMFLTDSVLGAMLTNTIHSSHCLTIIKWLSDEGSIW